MIGFFRFTCHLAEKDSHSYGKHSVYDDKGQVVQDRIAGDISGVILKQVSKIGESGPGASPNAVK